MIKKYGFLAIVMMFSLCASAQIGLKQGKWQARLQREDGHNIPFELDFKVQNGKTVCYILNGTERMKTADIVSYKDSLLIRMPVFESYFRVKLVGKDRLNGVWVKGGSAKDLVMPFVAYAGGSRFAGSSAGKVKPVQGKWKMEFTRVDQTKRPAIGKFVQNGKQVSGSVLTPAGDYRYLDGIVTGDSLFLSTFDGIHALLFAAKVNTDGIVGNFYSSASPTEPWTAVKDDNFTLTPAVTAVREGNDGKLNFTFRDLNGNNVSSKDERFKGKVVIIQLMGSWCPNCMDEMAFLSDYYKKNKSKGVEVVALAYELSTDEDRSRKSLQKFKEQFDVQYPILITGVTASDPERTEKTLPQLTAIKVFPTSIILDKNGVVSDISTAFYGPGTGEYYVKFKADFEKMVGALLKSE